MAKKAAPRTTMEVKEVVQAENGDLVINILAHRDREKYQFPYHIAKAKIHEVDIEVLKLRVVKDIDAIEAEKNQTAAIMEKLNLQVGKSIPLD